MSALLNPLLARCEWCEFELPASSGAEKQRLETNHAARCRFAPHATTDAVASLLTSDPSHAADIQTVIEAIEMTARDHNGQVDPNMVRRLLPAHVQPQVVGAVYNQLVHQRRLERVGWTTNEDRRGRNSGKPLALYLLREAS